MKCILCAKEVSNMENIGIENICSDCFINMSKDQKKSCQIIGQKNDGIINDTSKFNDYNIANVKQNKKGGNNSIFVLIVLIIFSLPFIGIMIAGNVGFIGWIIFFVIVLLIYFGIISSMEKDEKNREKISENSFGIKNSLFNRGFKEDKNISYTQYNTIYNGQLQNVHIDIKLDTKSEQIAICKYNTNKLKVLGFSDIIECEIIEDKESIMKGGIGRAVVGGVVAGGVGAIVGATTRSTKNIVRNLQIRIITKNITDSMITIDLITNDTKTDSVQYKNAIRFSNDVYSTITSIINKQNSKNTQNFQNNQTNTITTNESSSITEKIRELSKLKDEGIITQQEFDLKKQELLGKM